MKICDRPSCPVRRGLSKNCYWCETEEPDRKTNNLKYVYSFCIKDVSLFEERTDGRFLNEKYHQAFMGCTDKFISCDTYAFFTSKLTSLDMIQLRECYGIDVSYEFCTDVSVKETKEQLNKRVKELVDINEYDQARILIDALEQIDKEKKL